MATKTDICNMAIRYLGELGNINAIEEASAEAEVSERMYPVALNLMLEEYGWSFATKRAKLALLAEDEAGWRFKYACPSDLKRVLSVSYEGDRFFETPSEFVLGQGDSKNLVLYTDTENAVMRYVADTVATTLFPESFCEALALLLASKLAGYIVKGTSGMALSQNILKIYYTALAKAKEYDAGSTRRLEPDRLSRTLRRGGFRG